MDHRMHCIIPDESNKINHIHNNDNIRHCSFRYALHVHDLIYEGVLINSLDLIPFFSYTILLNTSMYENSSA